MTLPLLPILLLGGCTAGRASYYLLDAQRKFDSAVAEGAESRAPYEYTMSKEFLQKAKEESGYSDFGPCEKLAKKSAEYAQAAIEKSADNGAEVKNADQFVPEEKKEEEKKPEQKDNIQIDLDDP
jgi:hypothetical protein